VPVPRYFQASDGREADHQARALRFPLIVKPVDSQGSRGVALVSEPRELAGKVACARSLSPQRRVIVEEYFEGIEVVLDGFVSDYEFRNLVAGDRAYFELADLLIPRSTLFPWALSAELAAAVLEYNERLIRGLRPRFGITHSEFLVNPGSGEVVLVEAAIRGGGVFISSDLVPLASGIDVGELLVAHAAGTAQRVVINEKAVGEKAAGYFCFYLPEGVVRRVTGVEAVKAMPGVRRAVLDNIQVGWRTPPLADKTSRLGPILIAGEDRAACNFTYAQVKEALKIEVQTLQGLETIRWT
jgi:biotin carboxylase